VTLIFVDTETTGVDPRRHNIWEVALIEEDGAEVSWVINPNLIDLENADPMALFITHFYERMPLWPKRSEVHLHAGLGAEVPVERLGKPDYYSPDEVATEVAKRTAGKHLVGAVPSFDATFLTKLLLEHGMTPAWHYHLVDVEAMAAGRLHLRPPWDSMELARRLGVPQLDGKHTALGDARWAKAMYEAALDPAGRLIGD